MLAAGGMLQITKNSCIVLRERREGLWALKNALDKATVSGLRLDAVKCPQVMEWPYGEKKDQEQLVETGDSSRGARVTELRKARGWSKADLSRKSGLSQAQINHIESGRNMAATVNIVEALADAFGMNLTQMVAYLRGDESPRVDTLNTKEN